MPLIHHSEGRGKRISEFRASMVDKVSSRKIKAVTHTHKKKNPTSKKQTKKPLNVEIPVTCTVE